MRVLIAGCGAGGRSVYDYLYNKGLDVSYVSKQDLDKKIFSNEDLDRLFNGLSFIVLSSGISPKLKFVLQAKKRKIKVIGEFEFGASKLHGDIIGITGTNGKTTTVSLVNFLLNSEKEEVFCGGNIGVPVISFADKTTDKSVSVLEVSSFQLETISKFRPHIAAILNLSDDHLNRHGTFRNYVHCKMKITRNQTEKDFLLLNADCKLLEDNKPKTRANVLYFSTKKKVVGCYIKKGSIYFNDNQNEIKLVSLKNIKLVGEHNLSNILCSVLAVYLETKNIKLLSKITEFEGVPHRIEFVQKISGVSFFNDSKATNIDSTLVACRSFKTNISLILGGSDKGYCFDELFQNLPKNVKNIAIFGETKCKIAKSAKKFGFDFHVCDNLEMATKKLFAESKSDDVVLLSPACASFDQFKNYEERGNVFKKIVKELSIDENFILERTK